MSLTSCDEKQTSNRFFLVDFKRVELAITGRQIDLLVEA